jgi:glutamine synthetase
LYLLSPGEAAARGIELLPANLGEALDELERDEVLCNALGTEYSKMYLETKRDEWDEYSNMTAKSVTPWELHKYLVL